MDADAPCRDGVSCCARSRMGDYLTSMSVVMGYYMFCNSLCLSIVVINDDEYLSLTHGF